MKLITRFEARKLGTAELHGLRREAFIAFTAAERGSHDQRMALDNMRTVEIELAIRSPSR